MRLFLVPNGFTDTQVEQAAKCCETLAAGGHTCGVGPGDSLRLFGDSRGAVLKPEECDIIVSLGGDGSVLRAAQLALQCSKPLLGINSGRVGWLCAMDFSETGRFDEIMADCELTGKKLLSFEYHNETYHALNDILIGKRNFGGTVVLEASVDNGEHVLIRGDGLIISTPTGSTAYNLSAGGPVLDTELPAILLTPVCSRGSFTRSTVIDDSRTVNVAVRSDTAGIYADGRYVGDLDGVITARRSSKTLSIYMRRSRKAGMRLWGMNGEEHGA